MVDVTSWNRAVGCVSLRTEKDSDDMKGKNYATEEKIHILREADSNHCDSDRTSVGKRRL